MKESNIIATRQDLNQNSNDKIQPNTAPKTDIVTVRQSHQTKAFVYMILLAIQFGIQPILTRQFTPPTVIRSTVVLVQEIFKLIIAVSMLLLSTSSSSSSTSGTGTGTTPYPSSRQEILKGIVCKYI
jgi:hypothetical protein